jgi:hypothetical protein
MILLAGRGFWQFCENVDGYDFYTVFLRLLNYTKSKPIAIFGYTEFLYFAVLRMRFDDLVESKLYIQVVAHVNIEELDSDLRGSFSALVHFVYVVLVAPERTNSSSN